MKFVLNLLFWSICLAQVYSTPDTTKDGKSREASCGGFCDTRGSHRCQSSRSGGRKCICKTGYAGPTCGQCLTGFHQSYTSRGYECVKCRCSSSGTKLCDKQRGTCICKKNFKGKYCQQCEDGYIRKVSQRDELLDCIPILGTPVVSTFCGIGYQLINTTTGDNIRYKCKRALCECYGHSSNCTEDLENCTNCQHNTAGQYCHWCQPGYYGNAINGTPNDCQKCPCNIRWSNGMCYVGNNGHLLCEACKPGHTGLLCDKCKRGWYGDLSVNGSICRICNCSGNLQLDVPNSCDAITGKCLKCAPNTTGKNCGKCLSGYEGDAVIAKNCTSLEPPLVKYSAISPSVKEHAVIGICATLALISLFVIGFVLYRKRTSFKKMHQSLWTVEMTNRSYDDLDFSLMDTVSDTPYVYRTDINDYEEDALLPPQKSQLVILHQDVGIENSGSKPLDTVM